jgi:hypothetical protein
MVYRWYELEVMIWSVVNFCEYLLVGGSRLETPDGVK